jgi:hypothetical protein
MSRRVKVSKLKEAIRHLVLQELNEQENDKPDHFGGGENIDILGYKTKHFDICRSAVILYQKLMEKDLSDEAKELVVSSAKEMDHIFEMEKQVVNGEEVDHDPVEHGIELTNIISFQLGRVAEMIGEDFERDTNFIKMHVMEIVKRHKRDVDEASTTASAGAANPMGTGIYYDTPYAFRSKRKKDKEKLKKITRAGGYKPVNEKMRPAVKNLLKQKGYGPIFQAIDNSKRQFKQMKYSRGEIQDTLIGMFGSEDPKILQKIKESINESQPFADFTQFPKLSRAQQESLDELFGFAESYQIYNAFEKDPKKFIKTLDDMANIRKASNKKPKGVNFNKGKKQFVKEIANQEISALQNLEKGLDKLRKDYIKIMSIGDKTLKNKQYNDYYDYILNAKKGIGNLTQTLKRKQMLGEGRYHDWRNDESMTPKQKIGRSMREIRDALNELDKTVKMNLKLKTELKMKSEDYWKNTHKALTKISERLVKMANKVGNLK